MRISRRKFLVAAGSAVGYAVAPAPVRGLAVPTPAEVKNLVPQAIGKDAFADLPPGYVPEVGDTLFMGREGIWCLKKNGKHFFKLSSEVTIEQRNPLYWHDGPNFGSYAGLERSPLPILRPKKRRK